MKDNRIYTKEEFEEFETFLNEFGRVPKEDLNYITISKALSRNPLVRKVCGFDMANNQQGEFMSITVYTTMDITPTYNLGESSNF